MKPRIVGRSSSHFTRVVRIFAAEAGVDYDFAIVGNLLSLDAADYAGNPALKLPALETADGVLFGALNICRALARQSTRHLRVVWPEDLRLLLPANVQELTVQAMATEVNLIMAGLADGGGTEPHQIKMRTSLQNTLSWLDAHAAPALAQLPSQRDLSYLEVTLYCLVTHLEFRRVLPVAPYPSLLTFCQSFGQRAAARETPFVFDGPRRAEPVGADPAGTG